jgi:hypothetical protein
MSRQECGGQKQCCSQLHEVIFHKTGCLAGFDTRETSWPAFYRTKYGHDFERADGLKIMSQKGGCHESVVFYQGIQFVP